MMPATCVPWPTSSPGRVAPGVAITLAVMRELPSAFLKSGMSPLMPGVDDGDADALAGDAGGPQLVRADGLRVVRRQAAAVDAGAAHARVERDVEDPLAAAAAPAPGGPGA